MTNPCAIAPKAPDAEFAAGIATAVIGRPPTRVRRFTTGMAHYVYDVSFSDRPSIVARIGEASARSQIAGALYLSGLLRPRGVPLPAILAHDVDAEFPWMAMERLPGTDLGGVIAGLTHAQRDRIAAKVARAQAITGQTGSAGRFGFAVRPDEAPRGVWTGVLEDSLARSRERIASARLFDAALVDRLRAKLAEMREPLERIAPTPFLHDTTTKNVIVAPDGEISGIVDVDDLCFGDSRYPAALTLAVLTSQLGEAETYVSTWLRVAGQRNDRVFQLYVALFLLELMSEHGYAFNGNNRPSEPGVRAALSRAFEQRLALIG